MDHVGLGGVYHGGVCGLVGGDLRKEDVGVGCGLVLVGGHWLHRFESAAYLRYPYWVWLVVAFGLVDWART